jgi:cytochrome c oxidase subunit 1
MLFAAGFVGMFVIGGLSGVMHGTVPVDWQQSDSYFIVAHIHYVLFGGTMFSLFAGLHYWFPKFAGRMLDEKLAQLTFWTMLLGFNITFFPMHFLGVAGMPRRMSIYPKGTGWDFWNLVATIGSFLVAASVWFFIMNVWISLRRRQRAGNDPWDGATLEWVIPSPPPVYNFAKVPTITARDPFWVAKRGEEVAATFGLQPRRGSVIVNDPVKMHVHMPNPSFWPLIAAAGLAMNFGGFLLPFRFGAIPALTPIGILVLTVGIYGWSFEPAS